MSFLDLFSQQSSTYAEFRPDYPAELFTYLASLAPAHDRAWDCATGNGQAAIGLAEHFGQVLASDASADQLRHLRPHPRVAYFQSSAEQVPLSSGSLDMITVAQAAHWFDHDRFYAE